VMVFENARYGCCPFQTTSGCCSQHLRWGEHDGLPGEEDPTTPRRDRNVNINCQGFGDFSVDYLFEHHVGCTGPQLHSQDAARTNFFFVCGKLADVAALVTASLLVRCKCVGKPMPR
jgi:hypothetical protein